MILKAGQRVRICEVDPDPPRSTLDWKYYLNQSQGGLGTVREDFRSVTERWVRVRWDHGHQNSYELEFIETVSSPFILNPEMDLDEILLAQELVDGL